MQRTGYKELVMALYVTDKRVKRRVKSDPSLYPDVVAANPNDFEPKVVMAAKQAIEWRNYTEMIMSDQSFPETMRLRTRRHIPSEELEPDVTDALRARNDEYFDTPLIDRKLNIPTSLPVISARRLEHRTHALN